MFISCTRQKSQRISNTSITMGKPVQNGGKIKKKKLSVKHDAIEISF